MKYTQYRIGVVTNATGRSMETLRKTAETHNVTLDQILFPILPLSGFYSSDLVKRICTYDVVYYRTGMSGAVAAELSYALTQKCIPLVNGGDKHIYQHQKIRQALLAGRYGIPQPKSIRVKDFNYADASGILGPMFVVKPDEGSKGTDVALITNEAELLSYQQTTRKNRHIYQEYISEASEYRVYTVGGCGIATYKKTLGAEDFRANLHVGGSVTKTEPERVQKLLEFGGHISRCFGADISGVDILVKNDSLLFLELNWQPGWEQLEELTGVDFCEATVQYLLNRAHAARPWWRRLA